MPDDLQSYSISQPAPEPEWRTAAASAATNRPLINTVLFQPHMLTPLFVGRERSVAAVEEAMEGDRRSPGDCPARAGCRGCRAWATCSRLALRRTSSAC